MSQPTAQAADSCPWRRAATLKERLAQHRSSPPDRLPGVGSDRASRRVSRWRAQAPLDSDAVFARRLAADALDEATFKALLEDDGPLADAVEPMPAWWLDLRHAYALAKPSDAAPVAGQPPADNDIGALLELVAPLVDTALTQLRRGVAALLLRHPHCPIDAARVVDALAATARNVVIPPLLRALTLELHVAGARGLLYGRTPRERFHSFVRHMDGAKPMLAFFAEYPVLARQLTQQLRLWADARLRFLRHLCEDWPQLSPQFSPAEPLGRLVSPNGAASDRHRGGRSVMLATFESGLVLVYKPRSLAIELHFQQLLEWLNERGAQPAFRTLKVLELSDHGWVEQVVPAACDSEPEVQAFYRRQGALLALLYALDAIDFHYENLIAAGEHPVLLDLEGLFHPPCAEADPTRAAMLARGALANSVLRIGLLPWRVNDGGGSLDIGGLTASNHQTVESCVLQLESVGTDAMRFVRGPGAFQPGRHRPTLHGVQVDVFGQVRIIQQGFADMYRLLLDQRAALAAADGPLMRFATDESRVILRSTDAYARLLQESYHPDLLRDARDRDRHFDQLWLAFKDTPEFDTVIASEQADLLRGDLPMFVGQPGSCDVWDSAGRRLCALLPQTSLDRVQQRLQAFSPEDLRWQCWLIEAALAAEHGLSASGDAPAPAAEKAPARASPDQLLAAAIRIGDRLASQAFRVSDEAAWVGLSYGKDRPVLRHLVNDLYEGLPGVILFLAYLGDTTDRPRFRELASAGLRTLRHQLAHDEGVDEDLGAFSGLGGVIYLFTHLAVLWQNDALLEEAQALVARVRPLIDKDEELDVLGGAAGCLRALLGLHAVQPNAAVLDAARHCGERLLAAAAVQPHGIGWVSKGMKAPPLAGFSHGSAGISWALLGLAAATGDERFRTAALRGIEYERTLFVPQAANWRDLRVKGPDDGAADIVAWCHGATGIGLARLDTLHLWDDGRAHDEVEIAITTTLTRGFGNSHCLCHGDLGSLELLLQARKSFARPELDEALARHGGSLLAQARRGGWQCGYRLPVESPGLMAGIAGIGYGLLRLAAPERVPPVLLLAPPLRASIAQEVSTHAEFCATRLREAAMS
jgi:type 2 lantibiotic biosynthesis protein LanM